MRRVIAVLLFAAVVACSGFAQKSSDQASKEEIQQLFDVMQSRKMIDQMSSTMLQQIPAMVTDSLQKQFPTMTDEEREEFQKFVVSNTSAMLKNAPFDEMMAAMIPAYQAHLTHSDVQNMIAFYQSPTGKKLISEMPAVMNDSMQAMLPVMQKWMEQNNAEMQKNVEEFARKMKERQQKKDAASGKTAS